ncbi:nitrilase member 2, putative [Ichthyophthirius multifiliis]|uniref:Nitrilase member 2, putative n=1 Tax=Ichthyophthirius multifiliis TaxID=5932 RepID=G0QPP7_ICHMU|nr:nitrilase member 2, putative [Ichthyophthirius multifiliis]EGR32808.1 nitrilase member 2, putative [Ichthyophthirius multifiliis]|eukprot:XP_004036794.1 nitrilase member 2, putative [Ichthyophthirius multifiliis]
MSIIGSIPEIDSKNNLYNTCIAINQEGNLAAVHRKIHLFDINIPGKATYKESDTFKSGDKITIFDTGFCKIGLGVCYDIRFAEYALVMCQKKGAQILIYPGSFSMGTGPYHWDLLLRARAIDNLCYVIGSCTARFTQDSSVYWAWGHSRLVDPFGQVKVSCEYEEAILYHDVDLDYLDQIRAQIPIYQQKRYDIYEVIDKKSNI